MGKSLLAVALALSLTLVAPAQGQQGHENTFPTIHGMWEQDARTGQCFYHPPPPQIARIPRPCPPSMTPPASVWDNTTPQQRDDFEHQCYVAARTEALKSHKRFCLHQDLVPKADSLSMSGMALVTDTFEEGVFVDTPIISITCEQNWHGSIRATIITLSESTRENWGLMNTCRKY